MELPLGLDDEKDWADDEDEVVESFLTGATEGRPAAAPPAVPQTAFIVIIAANGEAEAYADPAKYPKYTLRSASLGDIRRACNEIVTEINIQTAARMTAEAITPADDQKISDGIRAALRARGINVGS